MIGSAELPARDGRRMDLTKIPLMAALKSRMGWLTENQQVLASNIANSDTPGYEPLALEKQDFSELVEQAPTTQSISGPPPVRLAATRSGHLGFSGTDGERAARVVDGDFDQSAPNGNAVDLEKELLGVAQTQMEYGLMVDLYRKHVSLLRTALGGSGGRRS